MGAPVELQLTHPLLQYSLRQMEVQLPEATLKELIYKGDFPSEPILVYEKNEENESGKLMYTIETGTETERTGFFGKNFVTTIISKSSGLGASFFPLLSPSTTTYVVPGRPPSSSDDQGNPTVTEFAKLTWRTQPDPTEMTYQGQSVTFVKPDPGSLVAPPTTTNGAASAGGSSRFRMVNTAMGPRDFTVNFSPPEQQYYWAVILNLFGAEPGFFPFTNGRRVPLGSGDGRLRSLSCEPWRRHFCGSN